MSDLRSLEQDIADRRSRLNDTIDRIQDKLTVTGIVDEVMGQAGASRLAAGSNAQLSRFLQRYPLPVMVAAAGIGFYLYRRARRADVIPTSAPAMDLSPYDGAGAPRYDPDAPSAHPGVDRASPLGRAPDLQA